MSSHKEEEQGETLDLGLYPLILVMLRHGLVLHLNQVIICNVTFGFTEVARNFIPGRFVMLYEACSYSLLWMCGPHSVGEGFNEDV